jgi:trimeric autotransporter adhesin
MTTQATSLLGLALPVTGELSGTWGDTVNTAITELLDSAVAGTTTLSADADVTLTTTTLAANQARQAILLWTASNGATTRNITAPAQSKAYAVINAGTGSIVLRGAGPTTGVTIVSGEKCLAAWNGSDFVKVSSSVVSASGLTGTVAIANGGTGQTTATAAFDALAPTTTAGDTMYYNGTDVVRLPKGTAGQALVMNSGATAPEWGTAGISTGKSIAMAMIFGF